MVKIYVMNKLGVILILLSGFYSVSCEKKSHDGNTGRVVKEFNACFTDARESMMWKADDRISVYDGKAVSCFDIVSGQGTDMAVFKGEVTENLYYYALYPYSEDASFIEGRISGSLQNEQTCSEGRTVHAAAVADGNDMAFKCVNSWLVVSLANADPAKQALRVKISSDSGYLAGDYDIAVSADDLELSASENSDRSVTLLIGESREEFPIAVFPGEYDDLTVSVLFDDNTFAQMRLKPFSLDPGSDYNIEVDCSAAKGIDSIHDPFGIIETVKPAGALLASYRNKYGMIVDEYEGGIKILKRDYALQTVLGQKFHSIEGLLDKYTYVPDRIQNSDYEQCTESQITYENRAGAELAIYGVIPENATGPVPFIIWIHGGGWHSGDPATAMKNESRFFASKGYASFRVQYRLMDKVSSNREQLEDIEDAVAYIRAHAEDFNIDPDSYAYIGGSAGGQLAVISGINDMDCSAIVPLYAVYDVKGFYEFLGQIGQKTGYEEEALFFSMDKEEEFVKYSPCLAVRSGMPPVLVIHGTGDSTAPYSFCKDFMDKMDKAGNQYETRIFEYYEHNFTGKGASSVYEEVQFAIFDFLEKTLK